MQNNMLVTVISTGYFILCFLIPLGYLFLFARYKSKKKNYGRAFIIALIMFLILFGIKEVVKENFLNVKPLNCYLNKVCEEKEDEDKMDENKSEKATKTTTSSSTTTTTSKVVKNEKTYEKVKEISGTKTDKGKTSKGYSIYEINGVTFVDGYLIANKSYFLPESYVPDNTYTKADGNATKQCPTCIENTAYQAFKDMKADAAALGLNIYISSGFRSYITQSNIYNRNVTNNGQEKADTYSARPGSSEHQTGLCFDLNTIDSSFANTSEGKWVNQNAHKYGYIIRYPKGKTEETGYIYEPWHLRYVGTELAEKLYNNGNWLTIEDYFGITSEYSE